MIIIMNNNENTNPTPESEPLPETNNLSIPSASENTATQHTSQAGYYAQATPPAPEVPAGQNATQQQGFSTKKKVWFTVGGAVVGLLLLGGSFNLGMAASAQSWNTNDRFGLNSGFIHDDDDFEELHDKNGRFGNNDLRDDSSRNDSPRNGQNDNSNQMQPNSPRNNTDDTTSKTALTPETVASIESAAVKAAGGSGVVTEIDNDTNKNLKYAYAVEVERTDGTEVTIFLSAAFEVVSTQEHGND